MVNERVQFFLFSTENTLSHLKLVCKRKIVSLSWNLVLRLMENSMLVFILSALDWKNSFWEILIQKIKIVGLNWNWVLTLIRICWIQGDVHFFSFWPEIPFLGKFSPKKAKLSQSWKKYMRQTLFFLWNSAIRENFNFYFSAYFLLVSKKIGV